MCGTKKNALELPLEASASAIEDAEIKPEVIDAVILPGGAGGGSTAGNGSPCKAGVKFIGGRQFTSRSIQPLPMTYPMMR